VDLPQREQAMSGKTQGIHDKADIARMHRYLQERNQRDAMMFMCGIYLGLRIGDLLKLTAGDVSGTHIRLREAKTRKGRQILIAPALKKGLADYCSKLADEDHLFPSRQGYRRPITRARAYEVLRQAARACGLEHVGTHSMRKSFGRAVWEQTGSLSMLRELFGHRDEATTAAYIGLQQDEHDAAIRRLRLF